MFSFSIWLEEAEKGSRVSICMRCKRNITLQPMLLLMFSEVGIWLENELKFFDTADYLNLQVLTALSPQLYSARRFDLCIYSLVE